MQITQYGFGDSATWHACTGHPNDPRTDDTDPPMSEEDALEEAEHQITCSPAAILWHLRELCDGKDGAVPVSVLMDRDFEADLASNDTLLVVMIHGCDEARRAARYELEQRLAAAMQDDIKREAAELLEADAKAREQEEA